jgi:hypothetical protein
MTSKTVPLLMRKLQAEWAEVTRKVKKGSDSVVKG